MDESEVHDAIVAELGGVDVVEARGDSFYFFDPRDGRPVDQRFPFATLVTGDLLVDGSNVSKPGVFRVAVGVSGATFRALFGEVEAAERGGGRRPARARSRHAAPRLRATALGHGAQPERGDLAAVPAPASRVRTRSRRASSRSGRRPAPDQPTEGVDPGRLLREVLQLGRGPDLVCGNLVEIGREVAAAGVAEEDGASRARRASEPIRRTLAEPALVPAVPGEHDVDVGRCLVEHVAADDVEADAVGSRVEPRGRDRERVDVRAGDGDCTAWAAAIATRPEPVPRSNTRRPRTRSGFAARWWASARPPAHANAQ